MGEIFKILYVRKQWSPHQVRISYQRAEYVPTTRWITSAIYCTINDMIKRRKRVRFIHISVLKCTEAGNVILFILIIYKSENVGPTCK